MSGDGTGEDRGRSTERLLGLIREHRDGIRAQLGEEGYAVLLSRLEALAAAADDRARRKALQGVRRALTALEFDHPVRAALESARLVAAPPAPVDAAAAYELLAWLSAPAPEAGPEAAPAPAETRPDHLRLGARTLSAQEARDRCGGPPPPELIRVPDARADDRYPQFQFTADGGAPYEVVLEVNRLLLADIDPWGAGAWWLGDNSWLGAAPASLLGHLPDHRLVGAATQLVEGE
ncbi:hypothetical protein GCM10009760_16170 [Kitasatospora kazusensis]|uniref:Uncharacterized protein n=1 Tax=Kitasatospora kazusensis TaxID=407974 RepID=A0ABP5KS67_9ACTN